MNRGKKYTIEAARAAGILRRRESPILEVRAFGTHERVVDACYYPEALEDARLLVAQELGLSPREFGPEEYTRWFVTTLGQQIGRMHELGYVHRSLNDHNVTLDCRIVDLDSVQLKENLSPEDYRAEMERDKAKAEDMIISETEFLWNVARYWKYELPHSEAIAMMRKAYEEGRAAAGGPAAES